MVYYLLQGATGLGIASAFISNLGAPEIGGALLGVSGFSILLSNSINHSNNGNGVCISIYNITQPLIGIPTYSTSSR
jgi:hypothetical protein